MTAEAFGYWNSYRCERLPALPFVPLILVLLVAAGVPWSGASFGTTFLAAMWALLLVAAFRLWDDLVDRELDRRRGLPRVVVIAPDLAPFYQLLGILGMSAFALALASDSVLPLAVLTAALALWYYVLRPRYTNSALHTQLLLLKYPAIVYLLSRQLSDELPLLGMTLVYGGMTLYEHMEARP